MTILTASGLTKSFGPHSVLAGVDLSIHQGERVGLVGANGSGKSTLARILAGEDVPDTGETAVRREARVMYLAQEPVLDPAHNVLDTVLMGMTAWWSAKQRYEAASGDLEAGRDVERALAAQTSAHAQLEQHGGFDVSHRALSVMNALGVRNPDANVTQLSGGEKRRVALARLLVAEPELAILDEPTNHLDIDAIEWLELHLADTFRGAVLLITHDRYFLDGVVDRTLEVERGRVFGYEGGFGDYLAGKAARIALAERTEQNRQNFLRKELDWLSRSPPARTTKQRARIERAESAVASRPAAKVDKLDLQLATARSGKSVLDLERVSIDAPPREDGQRRRLVEDFTFHLTQGERVGILGPNGCGKSTLLKAILGEHPLASGRLTLGKNSRIAYLSQHRTGLDEDKSILENVAEGRTHVRIGERDVHAISYLENFLFTSSDLRKPVKALSGGERTRVALAKLLKQETSLLLLDEPTNDLDLDTLAALEGLLLEHDITAIVVTHDRWFLDRIATSIVWFEGNGRLTRVAGNFTTVREFRDRQRSSAPEPAAKSVASASSPAAAKKKAGLSYKEQKELAQIEAQIGELEAKVAELDRQLSDPSLYQAHAGGVSELVLERDRQREEAERLMNRWAELEEKKERLSGEGAWGADSGAQLRPVLGADAEARVRRVMGMLLASWMSVAEVGNAIAQDRAPTEVRARDEGTATAAEPVGGAMVESAVVTEPAGYRELVNEALSEYDAGNYQESRTLLRRAHALFPNARSHRGIGMAEFELRNYPAAVRELEASLASKVRPLDPKLRAEAERLLARANGYVGRVFVETHPVAARLTVDGVPAATRRDQPLVLVVGDHLIEAEAPGLPSERRQVAIDGGDSHTLVIDLRAPTTREDENALHARPRRWYKSPWLWTTVGVLGAAAATGTALTLTRDDPSGTAPARLGTSGKLATAQ